MDYRTSALWWQAAVEEKHIHHCKIVYYLGYFSHLIEREMLIQLQSVRCQNRSILLFINGYATEKCTVIVALGTVATQQGAVLCVGH